MDYSNILPVSSTWNTCSLAGSVEMFLLKYLLNIVDIELGLLGEKIEQ